MSIHPDIYSKLQSLASGRVFPIIAPQGAPYPNITYMITSSSPQRNLLNTGGLASFDLQIDCWGNSSEDATTLGDACRKLIDNNRNVYWGSTYIHQSWVNSLPDGYEPNEDASEMPLFKSTLLCTVWASEPVF